MQKLLFVFLGMLVMGGCRQSPKTWHKVYTISGYQSLNTPRFQVGKEWKIKWQTRPRGDGPTTYKGVPATHFVAFVMEKHEEMIGTAGGVSGHHQGETYQHKAGSFFLNITTVAQDYHVEVWERR